MLDGVEHTVRIPDVLEMARIVLVMASVTVLFIHVSVKMGGLVMDVIFLTALEIQTVQTEVKSIQNNGKFASKEIFDNARSEKLEGFQKICRAYQYGE